MEARRRVAVVSGLVVATLAIAAQGATAAPAPSAYRYLAAHPQKYSVFLDLARRARVQPFLRAQRRRTFFVPTDAAFARIPRARLSRLRRPSARAELRRLLLATVVDGARAPIALRRRRALTLRSISGRLVQLEVRGTRLLLNGAARVAESGARVRNGWVYAISAAFVAPRRPPTLGTVGSQPVTCARWSANTSWVKCTAYSGAGQYEINLDSLVDGIVDDDISPDITKDSLVYIVAYGGAGNVGRAPGAYRAGDGGNGGFGLTATSANQLTAAHGNARILYYVGLPGWSGAGNNASGGGGGASTIATINAPPGRTSNWDPPPLSAVLAIGGGGGGGGSAGTSHDGGSGGSGAMATSTQTGDASKIGAGGSGGTESKGGGGGNPDGLGGGGGGGCS